MSDRNCPKEKSSAVNKNRSVFSLLNSQSLEMRACEWKRCFLKSAATMCSCCPAIFKQHPFHGPKDGCAVLAAGRRKEQRRACPPLEATSQKCTLHLLCYGQNSVKWPKQWPGRLESTGGWILASHSPARGQREAEIAAGVTSSLCPQIPMCVQGHSPTR